MERGRTLYQSDDPNPTEPAHDKEKIVGKDIILYLIVYIHIYLCIWIILLLCPEMVPPFIGPGSVQHSNIEALETNLFEVPLPLVP